MQAVTRIRRQSLLLLICLAYSIMGYSNDSIDAVDTVIKLSPQIRSEAATKTIPTIPINVIKPFLNSSQVVSMATLNTAPRVVALDQAHLLVGEGYRLYVANLPENDLKAFAIFRKGKVYQHPLTKAVLGVEAEILGRAQLISRNKQLAVLSITEGFAEINIGDSVMPAPDDELSPYFTPALPKQIGRGYILSVFGGLTQIGQYQVITLSGGRDLERAPGDILLIHQTQSDPHFKLPPDVVGEVMVFKVFDKVSFALVTKAHRIIYLLDEVASP